MFCSSVYSLEQRRCSKFVELMKGNPNDRNGAPQRRRWMAAVLGTLTRTVTSWRREKSQLLRAPAPSPGSLIREGGCTLYSPSSQHVSPMEFHLHPPGSPSQKPRGLQTSHTSPPPHTTTDQTASNSSLIFSGPLHSPTSLTSDGPLPSLGRCPKTYPLLLAPCLLQSQNAVWVLGQQPISACKALLDLGLHTPTHPQPHPGILML